MKCPKCGAEISDYASHCPACGTPIVKIRPKRVCTNCGAEVPDDATVCPGCGRPVKRREHQQPHGANAGGANAGGAAAMHGSGFMARIRQSWVRDKYAWLQAVLPIVLAFLYHINLLQDKMSFNLMNTALIFEGLIFFFGYLDVKEISQRPEMYGGVAFSSRYMYLSYFLPVMSFFERRQLPGMKRNALYPIVHAVLLAIFAILMLFTSDEVMLLEVGGAL
ncbi:zinc ribbon domain-containing protein [Oribacterium sp. Sow4_G1_1]|uniref:zinc ribbon domain-containing protein n=1 Tax=Oribacterium sp. Sow4_G1_1 TaxID=3438794 RepID=UPI003F9891CD